jgi:hypothetical protein
MTDAATDTAPATLADIPMDKLARVYRKMQAKKQELTQKYDAEIAEIDRQQDAVKNALKEIMLSQKASSVRTDEGTVVLSTKTKYNTSDWDAMSKFIVEDPSRVALLEKRIAQTNMGQFIAQNPSIRVPGLNQTTEYTISVRKPTEKE